jgi:hypothetical protein
MQSTNAFLPRSFLRAPKISKIIDMYIAPREKMSDDRVTYVAEVCSGD